MILQPINYYEKSHIHTKMLVVTSTNLICYSRHEGKVDQIKAKVKVTHPNSKISPQKTDAIVVGVARSTVLENALHLARNVKKGFHNELQM